MATRHSYAGNQQHSNGAQEQQGGMVGQAMDQMRSALEPVQSQAQHYVEDYPLSTVLTVFGIGLGVGAVIGCSLMSSSSSHSSSSNWLPSGSSSWLPSSSNWSSSNWMPSNSNSWFGNNASNWTDSMMRNAKSMVGY